jgi:hypothetical protein
MSCNGHEITFKSDYYQPGGKQLSDSITHCIKTGWWCKNTSAASIGAHETAHALESVLIDISGKYNSDTAKVFAWNGCYEAKSIVKEACDNLLKLPEFAGKDSTELIKSISGYAYKGGASETMAEAFADTFANGDNANALSKAIRKVTRQRYLQYKGVSQ